jgi:hypothetical protein
MSKLNFVNSVHNLFLVVIGVVLGVVSLVVLAHQPHVPTTTSDPTTVLVPGWLNMNTTTGFDRDNIHAFINTALAEGQ